VGEFALSSEAFTQRGEIPRRHTCEGEDVSPALSWSRPAARRPLAGACRRRPRRARRESTRPAGGLAEGESAPSEGTNDFGTGGWSGPCPPRGHGRHRYFFRLHALDAELEVGFQAARDEVERALAGHVVATAELIGTYER
jgi:phosphatidylethanolamine-binding protein (PEBP) family uncharacterized protein